MTDITSVPGIDPAATTHASVNHITDGESESPSDFRSYAFGMALHERMLVGDSTAVEEILDKFMAPLVNAVQTKFYGYFDSARLRDSVIDAVIGYWRNPRSYNPERKLSLFGFLRMAARRDFQNLMDKDSRQLNKKMGTQVEPNVEDDDESSELEFVDASLVTTIEQLILAESSVWVAIRAELPDERDQECAYLMLEGVRETSEYAIVYGITDLPLKEQEHVIKKHKDRIKKRLQRRLDREEFRNND